ncbi:heavy metal translocatin [Westerdykella ornata]|uniref:Heavy metal translocatin n=1 Tax=Westerdykella ornata TaxID=318751 RepID=A0A6A6JJR1_WESOR|nr:heavy metal translocatin [Westerdykella ornata]KAF2276702.1 heavy metal translocatin [Westerdykella ornata]
MAPKPAGSICESGSRAKASSVQDCMTLYSSVEDGGEGGPACFHRIILIVSGLKCGCCESGLAKALSHIPAIRNHTVNIVLARVEFDLNTSELSIQDVISRLHKDTGYTFEQLEQPDGQILELQASDPWDIYGAAKPFGVTWLESRDKKTWTPAALLNGRSSTAPGELDNTERGQQVGPISQEKRSGASLFMHTIRVHYDAKQIGAREVFEYYKGICHNGDLQLASIGSHPSLSVGFYQTKRASLMFLVSLAFTLPILVFAWAPVGHDNRGYAHASLALATIVQAIATREFVPGALQSLVHSGLFEMDFLIAVSTTTAYVFSVVSYVFLIKERPLETGSFFETSTLLVTLILLGRAVNEFARFRAAKSVSIRSLQTNEALLVISEGPLGPGVVTRKIDARLLQYGDYFKVPSHTRIVTDGRVVYGGSEVDESMITGESLPVAKGLRHQVHAGTMNGAGQLVVELTKLPHENSISRIATMVENAELSKPKVQALADKIAGHFVPAIGIIGILVFLIWLFVDRYHNNRRWADAVVRALTYAIATLIVSCPCAIGLAVPMVVLIAGGTSARFGIIFRDPQKLEVARNTTDIVFDKTGTLTKGQLAVVDYDGTGSRDIKSMIMGLLEGDKHPVAAAVIHWMEEDQKNKGENIVPAKMLDIQSEPGNGVRGKPEGRLVEVRAGNPQWLGVSVLESQHTLLCVTVAGVLCATFRLEDRPRAGTDEVVRLLQARNIRVHMISGDGEGPVNAIAHTLNIPKAHTRWRCKPEDKQRYVHELQKDGRVVCFCGDGTNDSAALKQADVGVHMNQGTDVAKSASDVVLMTTRLHDVLILLDISKAAYRRIIANFSWAAIYNVVAILMASGAFVKVRIAPAYAGLGELVSVLPVLLIAFQMKWRDYGRKYRAKESR